MPGRRVLRESRRGEPRQEAGDQAEPLNRQRVGAKLRMRCKKTAELVKRRVAEPSQGDVWRKFAWLGRQTNADQRLLDLVPQSDQLGRAINPYPKAPRFVTAAENTGPGKLQRKAARSQSSQGLVDIGREILGDLADEAQGQVEITGNMDVPNFASAELAFSYASNPADSWFTIQTFPQPVQNLTLAIWDTTSLTDGDYILHLRVILQDGSSQDVVVSDIKVRNDSPPLIETSTTLESTGSIINPLSTPTIQVDTPLPSFPSSTPLPVIPTPT